MSIAQLGSHNLLCVESQSLPTSTAAEASDVFLCPCGVGGWWLGCLHWLLFHPTGPLLGATPAEDVGECVTELSTHRAVEDEVDGVIEQRHYVEEVTERPVDIVEEVHDEDTAQGQYPLRQFTYEEEHNHSKQHACRAVVLLRTLRLVLASLRLEPHASPFRAVHRKQQQDCQHS